MAGCPEALMHTVDKKTGKCNWCGKFLERAYNPKPKFEKNLRANIDLAYGYYFDPNFGIDRYDIYTGDA